MTDQIMQQIIKNKDVKFLAKYKFGYDLTPGQEDIVRKIAFRMFNRISISAMTRWGKTFSVTIGIAILIDMVPGLKVAFIGPKAEQAGLLRQYMAELILKDPELLSKAMLTIEGAKKIIKEASKKRMTFTNGCEYRVFSAEGDADRLMGFGADVVVVDEACLVSKGAYVKIMRMLGDNPENSILIELYNPWDVDNKAYDHSISEKFETIRIDYKQAIAEGRTTKKYVDEQAEEYGGYDSLEFTVLYKSEFPQMSKDSIFNVAWIRKCQTNKFTLWGEVQQYRKELIEAERINKNLAVKFKEKLAQYKIFIVCDPADKGLDYTVIFWGVNHGNLYQIIGCYFEKTSDTMDIASKMYKIHKEIQATHWHYDGHGLGIGLGSRLRQIKSNFGEDVHIKSCLFGGACLEKDKRIYVNQKAVNYFRLRNIIKQERIDLPSSNDPGILGESAKRLLSELMKMKWKKNPSERTIILDPGEGETGKTEKSPDFADALVYLIWQDRGEITSVMMEV